MTRRPRRCTNSWRRTLRSEWREESGRKKLIMIEFRWQHILNPPTPYRAPKGAVDPCGTELIAHRSKLMTWLSSRWDHITCPAVHEVRDFLLAGKVSTISIEDEGRSWVSIDVRVPSTELDRDCERIWLPAPMSPQEVKRRLKSERLPADDASIEFLSCFNGLQFAPPGHAGNFCTVSEKLTPIRKTYEWRELSSADQTKWKDGKVIAYGPNGDMLILSSKGRSAWLAHDSCRMHPLAETFSSMLEKFLRCLKAGIGFDAYTWNESLS